MTPRSLNNRAKGFFQLENRRERQAWERVRFLSSIILQPHAKKGKKIQPTDIFLFSDEEPIKPKAYDMKNEEVKAKFRDMLKHKGFKIPKELKPNQN